MIKSLLLETTNIWSFVLLGGVFVVMMLITIIPQRKRQKQMSQMMNSLRVGSKVRTIGGFVGRIVSIDEKEGVTLNIGTEGAPVYVVIVREGIGTVLDKNEVVENSTSGADKPSI